MNINTVTIQEKEEVKKIIRNIYPKREEFLSYLKPFLTNFPIRDKYEKYLIILQKIEVKDVEEIAGMFSGMADTICENSTGLIEGIIGIMSKKYNGSTVSPSIGQFLKKYTEECSIETLIPYMSDANEAICEKYDKEYRRIDEKVGALPEEEKNLCDYFVVLITKLWLRYIITNPNYLEPLLHIVIRDYLPLYYKRIESLYEIEFPQGLLTYIEGIEIPDEEKWRDSIEEPIQESTPQIIPVFQQQEDIYVILKNYFDAPQQIMLQSLLQSGIGRGKLAFKSKANQLGDAFKKLYMANLITGCNKEELINWICANFMHKGKKGQYVSFDKKYLTNLISSELKPCKNPILEVKRDEKGRVILFSPNRKSGNQK